MKRFLVLSILVLWWQLPVHGQLESSNLPILVVNTFGQPLNADFKITAHLGAIENGPGNLNSLIDPYNHYDGYIAIKYRGSSSLSFPKKGFSVETRNADMSNNNVELLGLPKENDWVLHGPYSDKSLMRNALAYRLAESFMEYAPRTRFCELVIDGDYQGVYLLVERIKRDKRRLDIGNLTPDIVSGDELTGGYILKKDKFDDSDRVFTSQHPPQEGAWQQTHYVFHYPKAANINEEQAAYMEQYIHQFENMLLSGSFADSLQGYRAWIDVQSFIDFLLVQEISRNVDGYRISTYLYKDRDSRDPRLKMGPVWDFNLGFSNVNYCTGPGTEGWVYRFNDYCPDDFWIIDFWWDRLLSDPWFACQLQLRWKALRENQLSDERLSFVVDSMANLLSDAQVRNFQRWPILNEYVWPNPEWGLSYPEEVDRLHYWLLNRVAWMDTALDDPACASGITGQEPDTRPGIELKVFPNPGNAPVTFEYRARANQDVRIRIFNPLGQLVDELHRREFDPGLYRMEWNRAVPAGIYLYRVEIGTSWAQGGVLLRH